MDGEGDQGVQEGRGMVCPQEWQQVQRIWTVVWWDQLTNRPNGFGEAPPSPPAPASEDEASDVSEEYASEQEEEDVRELQEGNNKAEESTKA